MQDDIENVRYVEMTFDHTISFDIQEIADANNFVTDDIKGYCVVECHLNIPYIFYIILHLSPPLKYYLFLLCIVPILF